MSGPNGVGVLVVDDDPAFRAFLVETLTEAGYSVEEAGTGRQATEAARNRRPALVMLDVSLPDVSGHEICTRLRELHGETLPIVLISGLKTDELDRTAGLLIGADDYIAKPMDPGELLARIRRVALRSGVSLTAPESDPVTGKLTPREQQILRMLAGGMSQNDIAGDLVISPKTVGTHLQRILSKLEVHSRAHAVAIAHRYLDLDVDHDVQAHIFLDDVLLS